MHFLSSNLKKIKKSCLKWISIHFGIFDRRLHGFESPREPSTTWGKWYKDWQLVDWSVVEPTWLPSSNQEASLRWNEQLKDTLKERRGKRRCKNTLISSKQSSIIGTCIGCEFKWLYHITHFVSAHYELKYIFDILCSNLICSGSEFVSFVNSSASH